MNGVFEQKSGPLVITLLLSSLILTSARGGELVERSIPVEAQVKLTFLNPKYLVSIPESRPDKKWPLVIYLHGAGGRGDDLRKVGGQLKGLMHGVDRFAKEPCLFVAPQCLAIQVGGVKSTWISDDLNLLLAHLKKTLPMDEHRIYLTGNSMGGYGTWMWGAANPEHFAAIAPISGGIGQGGPKDVTPDLEKWAKNLATIPVFAFAGGKDRVVPADRSEKLVAAIQIAGGKKAKLKIYPDEGHNARTSVFASAEYFEWMFAQRRK